MPGFLLDLNVLVSLSLPTHVHHRQADAWFAARRVGWSTTPFTEAGYVRLLSNYRVVGYQITVAAAVAALAAMRALPGHSFVPDDTSLTDPVIDVARLAGAKQVTDFHLLNLAAAHGLLLATFDGSLMRAVAARDRAHLHLIET